MLYKCKSRRNIFYSILNIKKTSFHAKKIEFNFKIILPVSPIMSNLRLLKRKDLFKGQ